MRIAICGSMSFAKKMYEVYKLLIKEGHEVFLPEFIIECANGDLDWESEDLSCEEDAEKKKEHDLIRRHYCKIKESDVVLVINEEKNGVKNYIGANTLIEMAFAHVLKKKIYLLNELPEFDYLIEEVKAMEPIVLKGDLSKIKKENQS